MNARATRRSDDLPMEARIMREAKGRYSVLICFTQSRRVYSEELVYASHVKHVREHIKKLYNNITFPRG